MGHKTDQRRRGAPKESGALPRKAVSPARAKTLVNRHLKALAAGKRGYAEADEALEELLAGDLAGADIPLAGGRTATIVDQFEAKNKVFKASAFSRFKIEVSEP